ncbi:MAG: FecR domain-containing protein [Burkholderiaceae bacterium]
MNVPKPPLPPSAGPPAGDPDADEPIDESALDELSPVELAALRWSVRLSDGPSAEARAEFDAWLNADPAHQAAYEDIAGVWDAIDEIPPAGNVHIRASVAIDTAARSAADDLARAEPAPESPEPAPDGDEPGDADVPAEPARAVTGTAPRSPAPVRAPRRLAVQALTAVAAAGVLGGGWLGWDRWQNQPVFGRRYATRRGDQQNVRLPDGSELQLDTATQAEVAFYRRRREVRVPEGQVFFHVRADAGRPFDVLAGAARITVVGTRFSVRYTPSLGSRAVQVAVSEGRVRVASNRGSAGSTEATVISAGQALTADADGRLGAVTTVAADSVASWRENRLSFDGVPLAQVLAEIERYGDIGVRVRDPAASRLSVTASVDLRNLNAFVQALPRVLPVRLERRDDGVEIVSSGR